MSGLIDRLAQEAYQALVRDHHAGHIADAIRAFQREAVKIARENDSGRWEAEVIAAKIEAL